MICVTGASGTLSSEVIRQLEGQAIPFRGAYFFERAAEIARARGIEAVAIDFNRPRRFARRFGDATGCSCSARTRGSDPARVERGRRGESGRRSAYREAVGHGRRGGGLSLANVHRPVEKAIEPSGLAGRFAPEQLHAERRDLHGADDQSGGAFYSASGQARISHVDVRDIAAVAVVALTTGSRGQVYTLSGPEALTYDEVADELSKVMGVLFVTSTLTAENMKDGMLAVGMPEAIADRMLDLERYFREDRASRSPTM